jgi:iron complex outermembrane receptor protein
MWQAARSSWWRAALATTVALGCMARAGAQVSDESLAATTGDLKKLSLEDLVNVEVVSVSRHAQKLSQTPSAVQVITGEQIRRSGATSIPEALRLADNLDVAQKNSHDWAITARGFNTALANKLLVLIDGRTVYTPLFSGVFWDVQNTLLADVDRIEVISGPGGTQWGANAVNGVINIITKHARDTQGGYTEFAAGDQLEDLAAVRYGASNGSDMFFRVYAQHFNHGDEVLASGGPVSDAWNMGQGGFRVDAQLAPHTALTVQGDIYRGNENVVTGNTAEVSGGNLLGRWSHTTAGGSDINLQVYYDRTHLLDPIAAFVINGLKLAPAGFLTDNLDTFDIDFQQRFELAPGNRVLWGLGYRHTRDEVTNAPGIAFLPPTLDQNLYSGFVQDEAVLAENLVLTVGSKLEHNDYTGWEAEPSVRLAWNISATQMLWAAVSRAVRTPSRIDRDLSEPGPGSPLVVLEGSDDFVSEVVRAYELGYRAQFSDRFAASAALFYNDYSDVRSTAITPATVLPLFFQNNVAGEMHGLELGVDWQAADHWRLHASYDPIREHLRVRPGQFDFNAALNETADPRERASLRSSLDLPHALEFDAALRWTAARDINNGPTIAVVNSYWDMDARLGWHASERLELALVGQNLLHNQRVQYGFPGPTQVAIERSVYGKLTWHF